MANVWRLLAMAWLLAACAVDLVAPEPTGILPARGWNGEETRVVVYGDRFFPRIEVDAASRDAAQINSGFVVSLQRPSEAPVALQGVSLQDYQHLDAIVPPGLAPGLYDVVVEGPTGLQGRLVEAFTVSPTRADRIVLDSESVLYEVFETAWVDISLIDPQGNPVLGDLAVVVVVTDNQGAVQASFEPEGLEGQQPFGTGFGITGRLGVDGAARIGFSVDTPRTVDVVVAPGAGNAQQISEGTLKLRFDPGSDLSLDIALPATPFQTVAGTSFPIELTLVDQYGNAVPNATELVILRDACNDWVGAFTVNGASTADVVLRKATGTSACPTDRILSVSGPQGTSDDIVVLAGAAASLAVVTSPAVVVAGEPELDAVITAVDAFGNVAAWTPSGLAITDSVGGVSEVSCGEDVPVFCTLTSTVVGEGIVLEVSADGDLTGRSAGHTVVAGPAAVVEVDVAGAPWTAGVVGTAKVRLRDAWGNPVEGGLTAADVVLSSPGDDGACVPMLPADGLTWSCTLHVARADATLRASVASHALQGDSAPFAVGNGPLAAVSLSPAADHVVAGTPLSIELLGMDAFGNPYIVQSDGNVEIVDEAGVLSAVPATLDAEGAAVVQVTLTQAGATRLVARRDAEALGWSPSITVHPGAPVALRVHAPGGWVWVDEAASVKVEAVDAWGNTASWDGGATVTATGAAEAAQVTLVDGVGEATLTWTSALLVEQVEALATELDAGRSGPFAVVTDCVGGPVVSVTFEGHADAVACVDDAGEAAIQGDLGDAAAGDAPLALWGLAVGDAWVTSASEDVLAVQVRGIGHHPTRALVADVDGCADEVGASAWTAPPDGRPTGPLAVALAQSEVAVGGGSTTITVSGARDCARDVAAGGLVALRADRGSIGGLVPSGAGLTLTLGSTGGGTATLDASGAHTGGDVRVVAWSQDGAAIGEAQGALVGDLRAPTVWEMSPSGDTLGVVSAVVLQFSEPLLAGTIDGAAFAVEGPDAPGLTAIPSEGDRVVTLLLDPPVDASDGVFWVTAAEALQDTSGNPLDGEGAGEASPFVGAFGDLPSEAPAMLACEVDLSVFTPDGDPGPDADADAVALTLQAESAPARWVITVQGAHGVVQVARVVEDGEHTSWAWNGTDATGRVVPGGAYTLRGATEDAWGNSSAACERVVEVRQHVEGAP